MSTVQPEVLYSVYDTRLGTGTCRRIARYGRSRWPESILYFCPECGEPWGRVEVKPNFSGWQARRRRCPDHGPGLLLPPNTRGEFLSFPKELLRREIVRIAENFPAPTAHYHAYLITGDTR